jgi:SAM-dependent methyltransferase
VRTDDQRFTVQWDAVDPFDPNYPHLWIKVEHLARYLFAVDYLRRLGAASVADFGCGTGYGSVELANAGFNVIAIDESNDELTTSHLLSELPAQAPRVVQASLGTGQFAQDTSIDRVDAAVCFETLEHIVDPELALTEIRDLLNSAGVLILSVPNSVFERPDRENLLTNSLHRRVFSISSIIELVDVAGFTVDEVLGQPLAAGINQNETRLIKRKQTDGRIGDEPALHSPAMIRRLAMAIGYPEQRDIERSYSIILVARKSRKSDSVEGNVHATET